jgi:hypothetical protein
MTPEPFKWGYVFACAALIAVTIVADYYGVLAP